MPVELKPPSEEFMRLVCNVGAPLAECDFCGRTHFANKGGSDWQPGEHERLVKLAADAPDRYVFHDGDDCISAGNINGETAVDGCPCNGPRAVEDFLWREHELILDYLSKRAIELRSQADSIFRRVLDIGQARDAARRLGGRVGDD